MKIEKFTKLKDNRYKIKFDDEVTITLYDDVIVKYNLLVNKVMDNKTFTEITTYNNNLEAYYKSIKYINKKLRTKKEVEKHLKDYDYKIVKDTISKLEHDGYLNENIYLKAYINDQINLTLNGPYKISKELNKLGLKEELINEEIYKIDEDIWNTKINKIIDKKIKSNHNNSYRKLKDKIIYDLINLGYSKEIIMPILEDKDIVVGDNIITKEGDKIYNKLIKKYSDEELFFYLKNKLYQKGFTETEINNYIEKKRTY